MLAKSCWRQCSTRGSSSSLRRRDTAPDREADVDITDDDLTRFAAQGAAPLPAAAEQGHVTHDGASIWYATFGAGTPVILLHGGLGHGGNWGHQVPALVAAGYRALLIDSRGHGRSTRDTRPYTYECMASDVRAVMDALGMERAAFVGWSDGACAVVVAPLPARDCATALPAKATANISSEIRQSGRKSGPLMTAFSTENEANSSLMGIALVREHCPPYSDGQFARKSHA